MQGYPICVGGLLLGLSQRTIRFCQRFEAELLLVISHTLGHAQQEV